MSEPPRLELPRRAYSDADGTPISMLDAFYYSTVTVSTTGHGDIAPVGAAERRQARIEVAGAVLATYEDSGLT